MAAGLIVSKMCPKPATLCNIEIPYGKELLGPRSTAKMKAHLYQVPTTAYSTYSQLSFIFGGRLLHPQPEDATSRGYKNYLTRFFSKHRKGLSAHEYNAP
jgi:hypothetical protein